MKISHVLSVEKKSKKQKKHVETTALFVLHHSMLIEIFHEIDQQNVIEKCIQLHMR
jgi:hypothetical protein